jgi:hypothetical protein
MNMSSAPTSSGPPADQPTEQPHVTDVVSPELVADPFGGFARLRERCPVSRGRYLGQDLWLITGYEELRGVLSDQRFVHDVVRSVPGWEGGDPRQEMAREFGLPEELVDYMTPTLLNSDPPHHTRLRKFITRAFTVRQVTRMRDRIEADVDQLLDELTEHAVDGVVDLVEHFAHPVSMTVICEFLGVPEAERPQWFAWVRGWGSMDPAWLTNTFPKVIEYLRDKISERRAELSDDLLSELIRIHDEQGERLSSKELLDTVILLIHAGQDVTAHLISNGVVALLTHPDQLALLRADPGLFPAALTELMRWCSPSLTSVLRYASEDVEVVGQTIRRGEAIMPIFGAANRDPRHFADPDRFDITRNTTGRSEPHLGFGHGIHFCPGASLAQVEVEVALSRLMMTRFPQLALAVEPDQLVRLQVPGYWRLAALPVRLSPEE